MDKDRVYEDFIIDFELTLNSRIELRKAIVNAFLNEKGGYWKDNKKHVTRYKYYVETLTDSRRIYLLRPTFLNKGIDFQVWVEKFDKENDKRPSHKDIFADLKLKKEENSKEFNNLIDAIEKVWNCEEPDNILKETKFSYNKGLSVELLLKILKWLFIEQDITYWNYDGRTMLRDAILKTSKN